MGADLGRFFDQADLGRQPFALAGALDFGVVPFDRLRQVDRRAQARRAAADDHDVEFHHITFGHAFVRARLGNRRPSSHYLWQELQET